MKGEQYYYTKHKIRDPMSKKYAYVDCFEEMKEVPIKNPLVKYLGDQALKKYIITKFPNSIEEVVYANSPGYNIRIPLIKPLQDEDVSYINEVINRKSVV